MISTILTGGVSRCVIFRLYIPPPTQVLNLFLALLLSSFGASNLSRASSGEDDGTNKLNEAFRRIGRFKLWFKTSVNKGFQLVKDHTLECFRKGLSLERGKI